jgi:hypothetical protein
VVLISGEPGIGKPRIAQTIVERIGAEPHTRLCYFCSPHHQDSALYPSIAQLEHATGFQREDTPESGWISSRRCSPKGTNDVGGVAPLFADLLSIPTGDRYPPLNFSPQKRKERTLQALLACRTGRQGSQLVQALLQLSHRFRHGRARDRLLASFVPKHDRLLIEARLGAVVPRSRYSNSPPASRRALAEITTATGAASAMESSRKVRCLAHDSLLLGGTRPDEVADHYEPGRNADAHLQRRIGKGSKLRLLTSSPT